MNSSKLKLAQLLDRTEGFSSPLSSSKRFIGQQTSDSQTAKWSATRLAAFRNFYVHSGSGGKEPNLKSTSLAVNYVELNKYLFT